MTNTNIFVLNGMRVKKGKSLHYLLTILFLNFPVILIGRLVSHLTHVDIFSHYLWSAATSAMRPMRPILSVDMLDVEMLVVSSKR